MLFLVSVPFLVTNCKDTNIAQKDAIPIKEDQKGLVVNVTKIIEKEFHKKIVSNGKIESSQKAELRFKTNEQITAIHFKNGDKVKKGDTIACLDNQLMVNKLKLAEINFEKAKIAFKELMINYGLKDSLQFEKDHTVIKNLKVKSNYLEAENTLLKAKLMVDQSVLKAPFTGLIANLETKEGNYITPSVAFCTVVNTRNLKVSFSVLENDLSSITVGQQIELKTFYSDVVIKGAIEQINPLVDQNGLVTVKAKIKNTSHKLFDGMNVKIFINSGIDAAKVVVVPKEAVVMRSNRKVVFTLKNSTAFWNYVKVIDQNNSLYAISEGLKLGDTIILSGNTNISHGIKVNPIVIPQD